MNYLKCEKILFNNDSSNDKFKKSNYRLIFVKKKSNYRKIFL